MKRTFLLLIASLALCGCQAMGFYGQAIKGQYQILAHQEPICKKIANPKTPPELKAKFEQVLKLRTFANDELSLPADKVYLKYVDLHREYVVWTVCATPEFSMEPATWWFPIVGDVSYRGYFSEAAAKRYADKLKKKGLEVFVGGVETYSTLGWFKDPLLNTFINEPESLLADIIFHELAHRRLFIPGDTDFNEAFATAVAQEGVQRWFKTTKSPEVLKQYQNELAEQQQFVHLVLGTVQQLTVVYANPSLFDDQKRAQKQKLIQQMRDGHQSLKKHWGGKSPYDEWFDGPMNNPKLASVATYYDLVPSFEAVLRSQGGDLEKFFKVVASLSKLDNEKRRQTLEKYLQNKA